MTVRWNSEQWLPTLAVLTVSALVAGCRGTLPTFTGEPDFAKLETGPTQAEQANIEGTNTQPEKYRIQVGDTISLVSPDSTAPLWYRIEQDGTFTVPSLGTLVAEGKTLGELHDEIVNKDPRYRRFSLNLCACSLIYYVTGEIKSPGLKPYSNGLKVSQAIEAAGGFTEFANKKRVTVQRANGKSETVKLGDSSQDDSQVFNGDSVHVRRRRGIGR